MIFQDPTRHNVEEFTVGETAVLSPQEMERHKEESRRLQLLEEKRKSDEDIRVYVDRLFCLPEAMEIVEWAQELIGRTNASEVKLLNPAPDKPHSVMVRLFSGPNFLYEVKAKVGSGGRVDQDPFKELSFLSIAKIPELKPRVESLLTARKERLHEILADLGVKKLPPVLWHSNAVATRLHVVLKPEIREANLRIRATASHIVSEPAFRETLVSKVEEQYRTAAHKAMQPLVKKLRPATFHKFLDELYVKAVLDS
jgi:hypothetical protein